MTTSATTERLYIRVNEVLIIAATTPTSGHFIEIGDVSVFSQTLPILPRHGALHFFFNMAY